MAHHVHASAHLLSQSLRFCLNGATKSSLRTNVGVNDHNRHWNDRQQQKRQNEFQPQFHGSLPSRENMIQIGDTFNDHFRLE
jgi:hypothetical protein